MTVRGVRIADVRVAGISVTGVPMPRMSSAAVTGVAP